MMKTFICILAILAFAVSVNAQWEPDVRLTNNPFNSSTSYNNAWCVAANGSFIHATWSDTRDGNEEIYYKRSGDGGNNWGADTRLTNNSGYSFGSSIAVSGSFVHVVWMDSREANYEIFYKRSTDGGLNWGADTRLTNNSAASEFPSIAVSGSILFVGWHDARDGAYEMYFKNSTDGGVTWGADTRLTNNSALSTWFSIALSGSFVHAAWIDERDGNTEIYYKRSTDGGTTWEADTRLTNNSNISAGNCIAVSGSNVHVVWRDNRNGGGTHEIYYKRSADGGLNWGADTRLTIDLQESLQPSIAVSGSDLNVVWYDGRDGNAEIYYKRSTDEGVNWGADTRLTNNSADSRESSIAVNGSVVHVVWKDNRDGNYEIYYKRSTFIPSAPVLFSPGNNSIGQPISLNLVWNKPQYASKFRVLLATDSLFTNVIVNDSSLTDSIKSIVNLTPLTNYFWKVSAGNGNTAGWSSYSTVYKFRTLGSPTQVNLFYPSNNSVSVPVNPAMRWFKASDLVTNRAISGYWFELASDSLFTIIRVRDTTLTDTVKNVTSLQYLTRYWWRVRAKNELGWGAYSSVWSFLTQDPVGVSILSSNIPREFKLYGNYPNPFNPVTKIHFDVPRSENVLIEVYDMLGKKIATLVNRQLQPGTYETDWDATNSPSGVYFYRLIAGDFVQTMKMTLIR